MYLLRHEGICEVDMPERGSEVVTWLQILGRGTGSIRTVAFNVARDVAKYSPKAWRGKPELANST